MLKKNGVFDAMREKLWWFHRDAATPEAGKPLFYQHDGARPHTAKANQQHWIRHGAKKGFNIRVVTQPAQSPDLNCNDLAFFASLQTDVEMVAKRTVTDLVAAVEQSWSEYPMDRMAAVWRVLYASFKGIVETHGDNSYSHHTGSRAAHSSSKRRGDSHNRFFPISAIRQAEKAKETMAQQLDTPATVNSSDSSSSDAESDE